MAKKRFSPFDWKTLTPTPIIGVDEVGRGCLAGRVYAGAVILISKTDVRYFTDSKLLSEARREELYGSILANQKYGIGYADVEEIDSLNILRASLIAMRRAVLNLGVVGGHLIVDGTFKIPDLGAFKQTPLIKGDLRAKPVAAASIVAKVTRDRYMKELANRFPGYGFEEHKGYPTERHRQALLEQGISSVHRRSFGPVRDLL